MAHAETPFEPGKAEVTFHGPGVYPIEQLEVAPTPARPQPAPPPPGLTTHKGAGSYYPKS